MEVTREGGKGRRRREGGERREGTASGYTRTAASEGRDIAISEEEYQFFVVV